MPLPEFLREDSTRYAFTADEWLVSYAQLNASLLVVYPMTFSLAMVLELYLKAYAARLAGTGVDVSRYGHKIADLYSWLQESDADFPGEIRLAPELSKLPLFELDSEGWNCNWFKTLEPEKQDDVRTNYEIYMAMAYSADLKYGISPALPKHGRRVISSAWGSHNPWLVTFVRTVRARIGHPVEPWADPLLSALESPDLHVSARTYLKSVLK